MRHLVLVSLLALSSAGLAQAWKVAEDGDYTLIQPEGTIVVDSKAPQIILSPKASGLEATYGFFYWHDSWVYETLAKGKVESVSCEGGSLKLSGLWGTRDDVQPMAYQMTLDAIENGVKATLKLRKPKTLNLTHGVYTYASFGKATDIFAVSPFDEYLAIASGMSHWAKELTYGQVGKMGISVKLPNFLPVRVAGSKTVEQAIASKKQFDSADEVIAQVSFAFAKMPDEVPATGISCSKPLALSAKAPATAKTYSKIELDVDLQGKWENPYDPDEVTLDAFVTDTDGKTYTMPGFYMVPMRIREIEGNEIIGYGGNGTWKVRLTAFKPGELRVKLVAKDNTGSVEYTLPNPITITASKERGFVRVSPIDPHYFIHDNGETHLPIGHNIPIYRAGEFGHLKGIQLMAENGENWNRWWLSSYGLGLEWEEGLVRYRQKQAAQVDHVLDAAEKYDFYYMMCLDTHQDFRQQGWKDNPYNKANGGPCENVVDWFTNEEAAKIYLKRLRYQVARWTYSQRIQCWEFGNEFEGWANSPTKTIIEWHRKMAPALAKLDPYDHLITTSWWGKTGPVECWEIPEMDIVQTHCYTNNDLNVAKQTIEFCTTQWNNFKKPHIFAEFGIRSHSTTADKDPKGWALHNANWAALMTGCNGNPMPWWHENYIAPLNLFFHFKALRNFANGIPFGQEVFDIIPIGISDFDPVPIKDPAQRDVVVQSFAGFRKANTDQFKIDQFGEISDARELLATVQGTGHENLRTFPTFTVNFPEDGFFMPFIDTVSNSGHLKIYVDDKLAFEKEYPCGEGHGKSWVYRKEWTLWESVYKEEVKVPIAAGTRTIRLENHGKDWIKIPHYTFTGCRHSKIPQAIATGIASKSITLAWLQNAESTWYNHENSIVEPLPKATFSIPVPKDGAYQVEFWETWHGKPLKTETYQAKNKTIEITLDTLETDIALKIRQ